MVILTNKMMGFWLLRTSGYVLFVTPGGKSHYVQFSFTMNAQIAFFIYKQGRTVLGKRTHLISSTVSEYMVYGDLASSGSRSMAFPHSMKERAPSA